MSPCDKKHRERASGYMTDSFVPEPFRCLIEPSADRVWVRPFGELDLVASPQVDARLQDLRARGHRTFVIDLRGTTFIDSTGVNTLVNWHHRAERDGFSFAVVNGPNPLRRVLRVTGVDQILRFVEGD
jgi:anti-sigma B factor antagonist